MVDMELALKICIYFTLIVLLVALIVLVIRLIKTLKKYGIYAIAPAIMLIISIILIANDSGFGFILLIISVAALFIIYKLFMKEYRSDNYGLI